MRAVALLAALALLACDDETPTVVFVTIEGRPTLAKVDRLVVTGDNKGNTVSNTYALASDQDLPLSLVVDVGDRTGSVSIKVEAFAGNLLRGVGQASATIVTDARVELAVPVEPQDFVVNQKTAVEQRVSFDLSLQGRQVAMLPTGNFLVAWESDCDVQARCDSQARLFAADTTPTENAMGDTGDFVLQGSNEYSEHPTIAGGPEGIVASWQTAASASPADLRDVKASLFDFEGGRDSADLLVAVDPAVSEELSTVLARDDGSYVVTWVQPRLPPSLVREVRARTISSTGVLGPPFTVSSATSLDQVAPHGVGLPGGGFVITWFTGDGNTDNIRARVFDPTAAPIGADIVVTNMPVGGHALHPYLETVDDGFVVAWLQIPDLNDDDEPRPLLMQRFDLLGNELGGPVVIAENTQDFGASPVVATREDGAFGVAWEDCGDLGDGDECGIRFRLFHPSGLPSGESVVVNTTKKRNQTTVVLRRLVDEAFLLVWSDESPTPAEVTDPNDEDFDSDVRGRAIYPQLERHDGQVGARCEGSGDAACGASTVCEEADGVKLCHPKCVNGACPTGGSCFNNTFCGF